MSFKFEEKEKVREFVCPDYKRRNFLVSSCVYSDCCKNANIEDMRSIFEALFSGWYCYGKRIGGENNKIEPWLE